MVSLLPVCVLRVRVRVGDIFPLESLILAQDERWRRASHMQVERKGPAFVGCSSGERVSNT